MSSKEIRDFLQRRFHPKEFQRLLSDLFGDSELMGALPDAREPRADFFGDVVELLQQRELINEQLFDHLATARPACSGEIAALRSGYSRRVASAPVERLSDETERHHGESRDGLLKARALLERRYRLGPPVVAGFELKERYLLERSFGQGSLTQAWEASDLHTGQRVTVEFLLSKYSEDKTRVEAFQIRADQMRRRYHANSVRLIEGAQQDWRGRHFFVRESFFGGNLTSWILQSREERDWRRGLRWVLRIGEVVEALHAQSMIHGKLHTNNVLLSEQGEPYLDGPTPQRGGERITSLTSPMPFYTAPEANLVGNLSPTVDVFGLGMITLSVASGHVLFQRADVDEALDQLEEMSELKAVIERAIALDPQIRYATVRAYRRDLRRVINAHLRPRWSPLAAVVLVPAVCTWFWFYLRDTVPNWLTALSLSAGMLAFSQALIQSLLSRVHAGHLLSRYQNRLRRLNDEQLRVLETRIQRLLDYRKFSHGLLLLSLLEVVVAGGWLFSTLTGRWPLFHLRALYNDPFSQALGIPLPAVAAALVLYFCPLLAALGSRYVVRKMLYMKRFAYRRSVHVARYMVFDLAWGVATVTLPGLAFLCASRWCANPIPPSRWWEVNALPADWLVWLTAARPLASILGNVEHYASPLELDVVAHLTLAALAVISVPALFVWLTYSALLAQLTLQSVGWDFKTVVQYLDRVLWPEGLIRRLIPSVYVVVMLVGIVHLKTRNPVRVAGEEASFLALMSPFLEEIESGTGATLTKSKSAPEVKSLELEQADIVLTIERLRRALNSGDEQVFAARILEDQVVVVGGQRAQPIEAVAVQAWFFEQTPRSMFQERSYPRPPVVLPVSREGGLGAPARALEEALDRAQGHKRRFYLPNPQRGRPLGTRHVARWAGRRPAALGISLRSLALAASPSLPVLEIVEHSRAMEVEVGFYLYAMFRPGEALDADLCRLLNHLLDPEFNRSMGERRQGLEPLDSGTLLRQRAFLGLEGRRVEDGVCVPDIDTASCSDGVYWLDGSGQERNCAPLLHQTSHQSAYQPDQPIHAEGLHDR